MIRNMIGRMNFFAVNLDSRGVRIADWALSAASLAYAGWLIWNGNLIYGWISFAVGLVGCWMSWYRPMPRIQHWARSRFVKQRIR